MLFYHANQLGITTSPYVVLTVVSVIKRPLRSDLRSHARWGLFYGTERNGTERNDGLNCGTECFLRLKLAAYHCCTSYQWHFQQVIKRYPKKDKTNLRIDCGFLLVVISNEVLIVGIVDSVRSSSDISSRELMRDLFLLVCELFLLT